jgi:dCMP deaminase
MYMAKLVALRSTCLRHQVGCVLVDSQRHVIATGYNGAPAGMTNCCDSNECCVPAEMNAANSHWCVAIHAEQNALLQSLSKDISACYVTKFPCTNCIKMLMNTSCNTIYYTEVSKNYEISLKNWLQSRSGRNAIHIILEDTVIL